MVICLFFKGLPSFGEHGAESDPLRCLGGTLGGTITELTFMAEVASDKECNEVLDDDEATTFDLVSNGFHEFGGLSVDSSFSVIYLNYKKNYDLIYIEAYLLYNNIVD